MLCNNGISQVNPQPGGAGLLYLHNFGFGPPVP